MKKLTSCEIPVQGITFPVHSSKIIVGRNDKAAAAAAAQRSILPSGFLLLLDGIGAFIFRILDTVTDRSEFIELFHLFSHRM